MALELRDGRVHLIADFGSGPTIVTLERDIADGEWHRVIAERFVLVYNDRLWLNKTESTLYAT
jgi:hypothetical protein